MAVCASGSNHSLFLDPLGSVWSCGINQNGGLGLGHSNTNTLLAISYSLLGKPRVRESMIET